MDLKFSIEVGLHASRELPEELKNNLAALLEKEGDLVNAKADELVKEYVTIHHPEKLAILDDMTKKSKNVVHIDEDTTSEDLSHLPKSIRDRISKERGIDSKDLLIKKGISEETLDELESLIVKLKKTDDDKTKSFIAYQIIRLKASTKKESLIHFTKDKSKLHKFDGVEFPSELSNMKAKLTRLNESCNENLEEFLDKLGNVHLLDESGFKALVLEEQYDYLVHIGQSLESITEETDNVLKASKKQYEKLLSRIVGMDKYLRAALGDV